MASTSHTAFSQDGKYLAVCGADGKLKIWETGSSRLKQEFVPNLHLSSPCSVLGWIVVSGQSTNPPTSPWRKRKKRSVSEDVEHKEIVAMGSTNGTVTLYDISTSSIGDQLENGHSSTITAITWSSNAGLFTAAEDKQIVEWSLQEKSVKCKWKSGKAKVTSLALLPDGKSLLSGEKKIKWWDLETRKVIKTFDGHAAQVNTLQCLKVNDQTSYLFSSAQSSSDNYVAVWSLNETKKETSSIAALALPDEALSFSVKLMKDSQIWILSVTRSGDAQVFKYQPNGGTPKLIKPALKVSVAADAGQKESVQQIPIITGRLTDDAKLLLAYGSSLGLNIEKVVPDFSDTSSDKDDKPPLQCLIRIPLDSNKSKVKKEEAISKIKHHDTDGKVEYLSPGEPMAKTPALKRNKSGAGSQLPLKDRLENLSLDAETSTPNKSEPKGQNMAQLLIQGLHSGDETLLSHALYIKKESVIKNTVARLPVQAIVPLLKKVTSMLQGKTYIMSIGVLWLQEIISTHAATLISLPNHDEVLTPILSFIDAYAKFFPEVTKTLGRSKLITGQLSQRVEKQEKDVTEECLLVYQDQDSSDEDDDINKVELSEESGDSDNWEETSDQEPMNVDMSNGKSDDEASICSSD